LSERDDIDYVSIKRIFNSTVFKRGKLTKMQIPKLNSISDKTELKCYLMQHRHMDFEEIIILVKASFGQKGLIWLKELMDDEKFMMRF
ncbi:MAG: hypothetical protein KAS15_01975, partial [Nanoarchaeota archaeon]|nr:hypothetical protein [Nanoarchaeota archaeon]